MTVKKVLQIGDFTVFGFSKVPVDLLNHRLSDRLGILPRTIDFGTAGQLFFYTSYGDVAETEHAIALKLGFLRSLEKKTLSSREMLNQRIVGPGFVESGLLRGNALVVCLSKTEPLLSAYKTILGVPQLYYSISESGIICSDRLKCIVELLDHVELNEDVVPMHFLFRSIPGDLTYYRQIIRMLPGQFLKWVDGQLSVKLVRDLNFSNGSIPINHVDQSSSDILYQTLKSVVDSYITQVDELGHNLATLLSGGVDSSLLQFLINQQAHSAPSQSFSYAIRVPSFANEIEYARQACQLFHTEHTFVNFRPEDYPGLITRAIDALAQPPILATEPSMLSIAEFAQANELPPRYFMSGQGADAVFGLTYSKKLKGLHYARKIPGAPSMLKGLGTILKPATNISNMLLKGSAILACEDDPNAFISPSNSLAVYADLGIIRRCFGDGILIKALQYRREFVAKYLDTDHYLERIHVIDVMTDAYEVGVQRQQLFLAHQKEQLHPFFDDDTLRAGFAFHPDMRYIKGLRTKYLLKDLLEQKTDSPVARRPKGFSVFEQDLFEWMQSGPLRPLVEDIRLPGFLNRAEYNQLLNKPDYFLWILLVFDIFQRRCLA